MVSIFNTNRSNERATIKKYLQNIRPYILQDMINGLKTSGEWKIHLTMKTNFVSTQTIVRLS